MKKKIFLKPNTINDSYLPLIENKTHIMEGFHTKQEQKLFRALQEILHHSVDRIGIPKAATVKQLRKAQLALTDYENYIKQNHGNITLDS